MNQNSLVLALAACLFGCSSIPDPNPNLGGPPQKFTEFEAATEEYSIAVEAQFDPGYRKLFGAELLERGVIPIHLKVKPHPEMAALGLVRFLSSSWEPRLYLQDGTALLALNIEDMKSFGEKTYAQALEHRFVPGNLEADGKSGFLFFRVPSKREFTFRDHTITHTRAKSIRQMDLYHSLLSFNISIKSETHPFYVGVKPQ